MGGSLLFGSAASAADAREYKAGRIIDDSVFTNTNAMSVEQIQAFLDSKMPSCDTYGTGGGTYTNRNWIEDNLGISPPYRCVRDYRENPDTGANNYGTWTNPAGSLSSAELIYRYSRQFNINPQVLIVTLQKENGLITDNIPIPRQYQQAMGFGCPDHVAPGQPVCDPAYNSFSNQLYQAARHFRGYMDRTLTIVPFTVGWYDVMWHPDLGRCGTGPVYIENKATAALYSYTPYQPNDAAKNAQYGYGNSCSAYGNRNFYLYFTDWFGTTYAPKYSWQLTNQYAYTDSSKTTPANLSTLMPGQRVYIGFTAKNTGNQTWYNYGTNPVRVGTTRGFDRASAFYDSTWLGYGRPAAMKETSVAPGGVGTFEFWMTAPMVPQATNFAEYFAPLAEGLSWMEDWGMYYAMRVTPPTYTWSLVDQGAYTDQTMATPTGLAGIEPGQRKYVKLVIKNTGNMTWSNSGNHPINLGTSRAIDRTSVFYDPTWLSPTRPARMKEASVAPGQNATFEFWLKGPTLLTSANYREYFTPLAEGYAWMPDIGLNYAIHTTAASYTWSLVGQAAYTDETMTTPTGLDRMNPEERKYLSLVIKNTGNVTWYNSGLNPIDIGTTRPTDRLSSFFDESWLGQSRPARMKEASVAPGQNATFTFWMRAPHLWTDQTYLEYFTPVAEGITWMPDIGLNYYIRVLGAKYTWTPSALTAYSDSTKTAPADLTNLTPGQRVYIGFTGTNTGNVIWKNSGSFPLRVGTSNPNDRITQLCDASWISCTRPVALLEPVINPGQTGTFGYWIKAPSTPGVYSEKFNLLSERRAWLANPNFTLTLVVK